MFIFQCHKTNFLLIYLAAEFGFEPLDLDNDGVVEGVVIMKIDPLDESNSNKNSKKCCQNQIQSWRWSKIG